MVGTVTSSKDGANRQFAAQEGLGKDCHAGNAGEHRGQSFHGPRRALAGLLFLLAPSTSARLHSLITYPEVSECPFPRSVRRLHRSGHASLEVTVMVSATKIRTWTALTAMLAVGILAGATLFRQPHRADA